MKQLIYLLTVSFFVLSCSEEDNDIDLKSPEYGKDITLIPISNNQNRLDDESKIVIVKLGRKSRNCVGFGFCRVCVACGDAKFNGNNISIPVNEDLDGEYVELHLENELSDEFDSIIYIDEDLYDEDSGELVLQEGEYLLDNSLGAFGGYIIRL
jgi:hypothetical protein